MSLLDILSAAGTAADTPGSVVRGLLSGQAGRAFGGIFDPEQRVSGQDMLNSWGIDGGELGGMAAGIATDPLMWGGGALLRMLGRGGEAAATGARAAGFEEAAGAAGKAKTLLEASPTRNMSVQTLFPGAPTLDAADYGFTAADLAPSSLENVIGKFAGKSSQALEPLGGQSPTRMGSLLNNRQGFTVLNDVGTDSMGLPSYRAVGGIRNASNTAERAREIDQSGREALQAMSRAAENNATNPGSYDSGRRVAAISQPQSLQPGDFVESRSPLMQLLRGEESAGAARTSSLRQMAENPNLTRRHEIGHGIIDVARDSGDIANLPAQWRAAIRMRDSSNPTMHGLGLINEEAAMHGVGAGRGALRNLQGQMQFLSNPQEYYLGQVSPLAADLYGSMALPRGLLALLGGGGLAAGAASGTLGGSE